MPTRKTPAKKARDTSPYVHQRKKSNVDFQVLEKIPWTDKQKKFLRLAQDKNTRTIFMRGLAGTGKTVIAIYCALKALAEKKVSDIVYVRSVVESAEVALGYLPGDVDQKISPYLRPLTDKLDELLFGEHVRALLFNNLVTGIPVNHLRGAHFAGKYICVDEAQNFSKPELTTILSRVGRFSKTIICGDPMQSDLYNGDSVFNRFYEAFDNDEARAMGIHTFGFDDRSDIVRDEILGYILDVIQGIKK